MGAHVSVPMYHRSLPQRLRLEAAGCGGCGELWFPPRARCPGCGGREFTATALSGAGEIVSLTFIDALGAPPEFLDLAVRVGGYHVAVVALDEGPTVTGQLVADASPPSIGSRVRGEVRRLYEEEGVIRYGTKFVVV